MLINKYYLKHHQYKNANNLADRRKLFQYGTNSEPLWYWVAKQYVMAPGAKILEVGCGSGEFWQEAIKVIPKNCTITLTDFSAGMLESAKKNLEYIPNCTFEVADVENLLYKSETFDVVFAHLMLYHAASPERGVEEIRRILKPSGFAGILVSAESNMQFLFTLLGCENPRQAVRFSTEIALQVLPKYFSTIKHRIYQNSLKISEIEPLITYVRSLSKMDEKEDEFYTQCRTILTEFIEKNGPLLLPVPRHLFLVS